MIEFGKYTPAEKLERVQAYWQGRRDFTEVDRLGRSLVEKWERIAVHHGRRAVAARARTLAPDVGPPEIDRLVAEFCGGRFTAETGDPRFTDAAVAGLWAAFRDGVLESLVYTEDDGEIPTLDMLRARSLFYPAEYLAGKKSALAVFVTYFLGRNDVVYLLDAGIPAVTLVDQDSVGLNLMTRIYPAHWSYLVSDYRRYLDEALARGERFDVVSCDPPMFLTEEVGWANGGKLLDLCNDVFITTYSGEMMSQLGHDTKNWETMSGALTERFGTAVAITAIYPRIPGQAHHWVVLRKLAERPLAGRADRQ